jgi:hypothetical protein
MKILEQKAKSEGYDMNDMCKFVQIDMVASLIENKGKWHVIAETVKELATEAGWQFMTLHVTRPVNQSRFVPGFKMLYEMREIEEFTENVSEMMLWEPEKPASWKEGDKIESPARTARVKKLLPWYRALGFKFMIPPTSMSREQHHTLWARDSDIDPFYQ